MIDWQALLRQWTSLGRPLSEFWELSFWEVQLVFEGEAKRLKHDWEKTNHLIESIIRSDYYNAYVNAVLVKTTKNPFPDFQKFNPLQEQSTLQSVETQIATVKSLHAIYGGALKIDGVLQ